MQDVFIEYMVKRQKGPQTHLLRILVILAVIVVIAAVVLFGASLGVLSFFAPVIVIAAVYGAHRLLTSMNVEYEYAVTNGEMDVDQIIAQRRRKRLVTINFREVESFGRYHPEAHQSGNYQSRVIACDHPASPELWCCVARLTQGGRTLVVFNANQKMLDAIKPFLPRPIMHEAFRAGQ